MVGVLVFDEANDYVRWVLNKDKIEIISVVVFKNRLVVTYKNF